MVEISVRPLAPDEDDLWLASGAAGRGDEVSHEKSSRRLESRVEHDARCFLIAHHGKDVIARLRGVFLKPTLYAIEEISACDEEHFEEAACAFARFLSGSFAADGVGLMSTNRAVNGKINDVVSRSGFRLSKSKRLVKRSLEGYRPSHQDPFTYRSLADAGEDEFLRVLTEASAGDPFEDMTERDPRADFQELLDYAGARFDATWWQIADLDQDPVGVVLPQVFPKSDDEGTLFYIGVRPAYRGRGYGRLLHAKGLAFLAEHGVARYLGSTDTRNLAMLAVMEANGCVEATTQLFYEARP